MGTNIPVKGCGGQYSPFGANLSDHVTAQSRWGKPGIARRSGWIGDVEKYLLGSSQAAAVSPFMPGAT